MSRDTRPARAAMQGDGFYNRNSSAQAEGISRVMALWERTASAVEVGDEALVVADYGSSQGRNSMAPVRVAIDALRAKAGPDRPVQVIHTDLPSNDFASLFKALHEDDESYLAERRGIFPAAIGRSYFEPVIAPGQVHLGWNSWTLHWLSHNTIEVADHALARLSSVAAVRAAAAKQAADDWEQFLLARSSELRIGGKLLSLIMIRTDESSISSWMPREIWDIAAEMHREGLLSASDLVRVTLPIQDRSLAEIEAPFAAGGQFAGLELEHAELTQAADAFWDDFERTGDAAQLGRSWANTTRAIFGPTIEGTIAADGDRSVLVDEMFARLAVRIAAAPRRRDYDLAVVVLGKRA